jgi:hypothetical protein
MSSTSNNDAFRLSSIPLDLSPDVRIKVIQLSRSHVAVAGPISSSDDAKITDVQDGIAIPHLP